MPETKNTAELDNDIATYDRIRDELEARHMGKWVLIYKGELVVTHDSFEAAAEEAVRRFGRGPYLIRQIGAPPVTLPVSAMFRVGYAKNKMRVR